jgi:enediyne biosynthesis protein E5
MNNLLKLSPKTYMAGLLVTLAIWGTVQQGYKETMPQLILAVLAAVLLDFIWYYAKTKKILFPSSAFITGIIIGLVLSPGISWYIPVISALLAIGQKHLIHFRSRHVFNPANFGLLTAMFIFSEYPGWWAEQPWLLIVLAGLFICYKMKRIILPVVFIATYTVMLTLNNLMQKQPLLEAVLSINIFFILVMLIEPKTTPVSRTGIVLYAILVAMFSFVFFKVVPQYDFSILALTLGNILVPVLNRITRGTNR